MTALNPLTQKDWLVDTIAGAASWSGYLATLLPGDHRNARSSRLLLGLADAVKALPVAHPLFAKLNQIDHADTAVRDRWLDEVRLEISYIGLFSDATTREAIRRLEEITDASLTEWRQSNLH
jgi:hypothetical protein